MKRFSPLTKSIKIKLQALAEMRDKSKLEVLNEALDRAIAVHRVEIRLKTACMHLEMHRQDMEVQKFIKIRRLGK